ncbi:ATP-binding cassette domain-containing protein [Gordonia jinghuaiqii]|uniref:ABC transporter ATP-binding protein n=1 Tax=Gordonia jinghuaiqii TaxID=2758710 RepID=A0A7D7QXS1_9ACTN|nr:ABC transporter ATP-binding protein [Gordonia jinghuaiqii]MCR5980303.1 ATP-binding cassette domain-containing protein [Gordonia jinghuaiqii]QMT01949.1 ABC transporter ATP-binding protein [Gordonia jinghuaiqii]
MSLLEISGLSVEFRGHTAVDDVDLRVDAGESVALVGGSGAGKSTVAKVVAGLVAPSAGAVTFDGVDILSLSRRKARPLRRDIHLVFQDPYASLPPTLRVADIVAEPLVIHGIGNRTEQSDAVARALEAVNLTPAQDYLNRFQHQLSGGERQRVAFARAVVAQPRLILADEPTSGLDASLRMEIIDLMDRLCRVDGIAIVHITHDLALAQRGSSRVVVMRAGRVVESGPVDEVLSAPRDPYTARLVSAASRPRDK